MANSTMRKFGFPDSLVREFDHWVILVRPAQVTLGSLILAAKSDVTAFSDLPAAAFAELSAVTAAIEAGLRRFTAYERINYLMLMMVDPHVHFHVVPRYSQPRDWHGIGFADSGWPGPPDLKLAVEVEADQMKFMIAELKGAF